MTTPHHHHHHHHQKALNVQEVAKVLGLSSIDAAPPANMLPANKPKKPFPELIIVQQEENGKVSKSQNNNGFSLEQPFFAQIDSCQWLTQEPDVQQQQQKQQETEKEIKWNEQRQVLSMRLCIRNSMIANYQPGDSIGIIAPNPRQLVLDMIALLCPADKQHEWNEFTNIATSCLPAGFAHAHEKTINLFELLSFRVDLTGPMRKLSLQPLLEYCESETDKIALQWLYSKTDVGKKLWEEVTEKQGLGIGELLLDVLPSCKPPLSVFLSCCSSMRPRFYSICSSPLVHPDHVVIAFSIERFTCQISTTTTTTLDVPEIKRTGHCTNYLLELCQPLLNSGATQQQEQQESSSSSSSSLRVFHKATLTFHLPGSVGPPLILIGPGTGVAPFIGFLEHRHYIEKQRQKKLTLEMCCGTWRGAYEIDGSDLPSESNQVEAYIESIVPGPVHLFFGCRGREDYLFQQQLESFVLEKTLTSLEVAMSRTQAVKQYVTDKIRLRGVELSDLLLNQGAHVYVCGDGNTMAKDVAKAFTDVLETHGNMTTEAATEFIQQCKLRRRYVLDIW